jgi:anti-sigma B factor antagonist
MIIEHTQQQGHTVYAIAVEEASIRNAEEFKTELVTIIDEGHKKILLSFEMVTYIDSSFLGSMVSALKHAISKGADIYLVNLRADIYDLLCLIRMNKVFKIYDTTAEAIEHIG